MKNRGLASIYFLIIYLSPFIIISLLLLLIGNSLVNSARFIAYFVFGAAINIILTYIYTRVIIKENKYSPSKVTLCTIVIFLIYYFTPLVIGKWFSASISISESGFGMLYIPLLFLLLIIYSIINSHLAKVILKEQ